MLINRANLADMFRGFQTIFQGAWDQAAPMYAPFVTTVPSVTSEEKYAWLGTMPRFREWVGDRVINSLKTHDYTIRNKNFENTIEVDANHILDDQLGVYRPMIEMLGAEARTHPDELVFDLLKNGDSTLCYDGQYFFDTDHPVTLASGAAGTWSNWGGGSGALWMLLDLRRPIKPVIWQERQGYQFVGMTSAEDEAVFMQRKYRYGVDARVNVGFGLPHLAYGSKQTLDATAYATARAAMGSLKGDGGKVLAIQGNTLLVAPSLEKAARECVVAQRGSSGADNVMAGTAQVVVCPWFA